MAGARRRQTTQALPIEEFIDRCLIMSGARVPAQEVLDAVAEIDRRAELRELSDMELMWRIGRWGGEE